MKDAEYLYSNIVLNATKGSDHAEVSMKFRKNRTSDDITLIAPLNEEGSKFFYNVKSFSLAARGNINYNGEAYEL